MTTHDWLLPLCVGVLFCLTVLPLVALCVARCLAYGWYRGRAIARDREREIRFRRKSLSEWQEETPNGGRRHGDDA